MFVTLVCRNCRLAFPRHSRPWHPVVCTACGNRMVVLEDQAPPRDYEIFQSPAGPRVATRQPQAIKHRLENISEPRTPHPKYHGRDRWGRFLPKPWHPAHADPRYKPPSRRGMFGQRTPVYARRCRQCEKMFTGFSRQRYCCRRCRNRAFYLRNTGITGT